MMKATLNKVIAKVLCILMIIGYFELIDRMGFWALPMGVFLGLFIDYIWGKDL